MNKEALRQRGLKNRESLSSDEVCLKSEQIFEKIYSHHPDINQSEQVLAYYSFRNEVETRPFIENQITSSGSILLPRVEGNELRIHRIFDFSSGSINKWGIWEPTIGTEIPFSEYKNIQIVIVPGVVFDAKGNRIGFGKGYYDRLLGNLSKESKKWGVCYECQIFPEIKPENHDIQMDAIFTERNQYV